MSKKEPLTLDMVKEKRMSAIDVIKYCKPDWTDEQCDEYICEFIIHNLIIYGRLNEIFSNHKEPIEPPTKL